MRISLANSPGELAAIKNLFAEYWASFGFSPCFQNFDAEVADLPGSYASPEGRLAIARIDKALAGCIAMRRLDDRRCEAKRLYVRPGFRGRGVGGALVEWLIAEARTTGYSEMVCDTMPFMQEALAMYERKGFERTGPYADSPTPGAIYLRLALSALS